MFLQFELWKECSFGCKFCFNRDIERKRNKIDSIKATLNVLNSEKADDYDEFGIIGGEFFNGELDSKELHDYFYELIDTFINKIKTGKAKRCLITTALMYDKQDDWFEFCNYIKKASVEDKFLICTSFDLIGRFNDKKLNNWSINMKITHELYPDLKLHVEMITTQVLLESIMNNTFKPKEFEQEYHCHINYMIPVTGYSKHKISKQEFEQKLPGFFPKRETFLKFLQYVYENKIFNYDELYNFINIVNHSDTCYFGNPEDKPIILRNRHKTENKTSPLLTSDTYGYLDSNVHPRIDVENFLDLIGE